MIINHNISSVRKNSMSAGGRMSVALQRKIEEIGDGFGLLLPRELPEACGFGAEVTLTVQNSILIVSPGPQEARQGWAEALEAIPQAELDRDFEELQSFRHAPDEWDSAGFTWLGGSVVTRTFSVAAFGGL
jgi:antitoxin component of MazEF toxin-antitoxin module